MRHLKKISLLLGAFVVVLALTIGAILYVVFDVDRYKSAITERLSEATGMQVAINDLRLGILRGVAIEGRDIVLKDPSNPYPQITIERLTLGLKTRPLLSKQVIIKRLNVKGPVLSMVTTPSSKPVEIKPLATRLLRLTSQAAERGFFLEVRSVDIQQGQVIFRDSTNQEKTIAEIRDMSLKLSGLKSLSPTRYAASGTLKFNDDIMPFSFRGVTNDLPTRFDPALVAVEGTGRIKNVPGQLVKNFLMPQGPVQALEGIFDIQTHYRGNLGGAVDAEGDIQFTSLYVDYPKLFKNPLRADEGTIKYALTFKDDSLMVRRFEIASKETAFKGSFSIEHITSEHGVLRGELSTTAMSAEQVVQLLPSSTSAKITGLVNSMKPSGDMEVKHLEASGPFQVLQSDKEVGPVLTASADLVLRNLGLTFSPDIPPFKNWKGEISYDGRKITFHDVGGIVGEESQIESLNGSILGIASDDPNANLNIVTHLRAGDFRTAIQRWLSRERPPLLSENTTVEGALHANLAVIGPIKDAAQLNISGTVSLENLSINDPELELSLDKITGLLKANGGQLEIENLTLLAKERPVRVSGKLNNYMGEIVTFKDVKIDLGDGLPRLRGVQGYFDKANYVLVVETRQPITYGEGEVRALHAEVSDLNKTPTISVALQGKFTPEQVYKLAKLAANTSGQSAVLETLNGASGKIDVQLNASGTLRGDRGINWSVKLNPEGLTFMPPHPLEKVRNIHGNLTITPALLNVDKLVASVGGDSSITLSGKIQNYLAADPMYDLTAETSGMELAEALKLLPIEDGVPEASGVIKGRITAVGPLMSRPESCRLNGVLYLNDGNIRSSHTPELTNITAQMLFKDDEAVLEKADFTLMDSPASMSGSVKGFSKPVISMKLKLQSLDLDQMVQAQEGEGPWVKFFDKTLVFIERASGSPLLRTSTLNLDAEIEEGKLGSHVFGPIKGESTLKERKFIIKSAEVATSVGVFRGDEVFMDLSGLDPTIFGLKADLVDGDVGRMVSKWGPEWNVVTGTINATTSLKCQEEGIVRGLVGCLQGHLIVRLNDGYVRKTGIVEPLAEKLNFSKSFRYNRPDTVPTLPYKTISGDFVIQDGILTTNNFSIDGSKIKIATDGQVNLFRDTMDLKVSVLTFNAINQLVHQIPLVNLIAEDDKSLVATYYEVSGGMEEPQVVSIQNHSLEMVLIRTFHKIFEVPTRIIKAPIELMNQIPPPGTGTPPTTTPVLIDN